MNAFNVEYSIMIIGHSVTLLMENSFNFDSVNCINKVKLSTRNITKPNGPFTLLDVHHRRHYIIRFALQIRTHILKLNRSIAGYVDSLLVWRFLVLLTMWHLQQKLICTRQKYGIANEFNAKRKVCWHECPMDRPI